MLYHPKQKPRSQEGRGPQTDTCRQVPLYCRSIFKKSRQLGLESISYFVHDSLPHTDLGVCGPESVLYYTAAPNISMNLIINTVDNKKVSMMETAGKNHLNEEITPPPLLPTGIDERYYQTISNLGYAALLRRCDLIHITSSPYKRN